MPDALVENLGTVFPTANNVEVRVSLRPLSDISTIAIHHRGEIAHADLSHVVLPPGKSYQFHGVCLTAVRRPHTSVAP